MKDNLLNDWIEGRSDKTYVSRFDKVSLGWEDDVLPGQGYSSMIYEFKGDETPKDLISMAYRIGRNRLDSMGLFKNTLRISTTNFCSNGKFVMVGTNVFDNEILSPGQRVDTFLGGVVHEAAHVLYTDFKYMDKVKKNPILKMLWNIVEDEYIEREIGKDFPGYSNYIAAVKAELLGKVDRDVKATSEIDEILNTVLMFVRYPKALDLELVEKHEELLVGVKLLFEEDYPDSTKKCMDLAESLYTLIEQYYEEPPESEKGDGDPSGESDSESGGEGEERSSEEKSKSETDGDSSPMPSAPDPSGKKSSDDSEGTSEDKKRSFSEDGRKFASEIIKEIESSTMKEELEDKDTSREVDEVDLMELEGNVEYDRSMRVIAVPMKKGNQSKYNEYKKAVKSKISALSTKLNFDTYRKTMDLRGLRNGSLDESKLVEGKLGEDKIYSKKVSESVKGGVFGLLLDESGSMNSRVSGVKSRMNIACELAVLFNEALKKTPLESYIYGHSGDNYVGTFSEPVDIDALNRIPGDQNTFLNIYKEKNKDVHKYSLGYSRGRSQNRDGFAIYSAIKRIRQQTDDHIYMIVISDGSPCAHYYGGNRGVRDTRDKILKAQKEFNATVIGVGINVHYDMDSMYPENINFTDLGGFVSGVGKLIRKIIKQNYK